MRRRDLILSGLAAGLSGCMVGPGYRPLALDLPERFSGGALTPPQLKSWWERFGDPLLNTLIAEADADGLDVKVAAARVAQARALQSAASAQRLPEIDAAGDLVRSRAAAPVGDRFQASISERGAIGAIASWEIDLFGRVSRSVAQASANTRAAEADLQAARLALSAEVARTYIVYRSYERRLALQQQGYEAQAGTAKLTRALFQGGEVGVIDVDRAEAQAASTASLIPSFEAERQAGAFQLAVLTGKAPDALVERLHTASTLRPIDDVLAAGLPADLVRRRPDIRAAEARLVAAYAAIGVAEADLYPRLTLSGAVGVDSGRINDGSLAGFGVWSIAAGLLAPLFDGGRRRAIVRARRAECLEAEASYRKTVLQGLEETEEALVRFEQERHRRADLATSAVGYERADVNVRRAWRGGEIPFLNVLDADRSLVAGRDALAASDAALAISGVRLFAALGGGWEAADAIQPVS